VVPYRVQALTAGLGGSGSASYDGPMVYDATAGVYVRPHPTGLLAGDGTEPVPADPDDYDRTGDDWFVESVSATLRERLDAVGEDRAVGADGPAVECAWAGLCTATPDGDPLVSGQSATPPTACLSPPAGRATGSCARQRSASSSPKGVGITRRDRS